MITKDYQAIRQLSPGVSRLIVLIWWVVAVAGMAGLWNRGQFLERGLGGRASSQSDSRNDMEFYHKVVVGVRDGQNYYDVARENLPDYFQRYGSVFNWRLPTYAYVLAFLRNDAMVRIVLLGLILIAVVMSYHAERQVLGLWPSNAIALLLFIVLGWVFQDAIFTQELWAATLLAVSLGAWGIECRSLAVAAGLAALAFRELMLPYPVVAGLVCYWSGRRRESFVWLTGIVLFFVYLLWHRAQVQHQLAQMPPVTGGSVDQWLRFGGIDFLLLTGRMTNVFLFPLPGGVVFLTLWLAFLGFVLMPGPRGCVMLMTTSLFWCAFLIIGEPHNFYWGLLYAPIIPFGWIRGVVGLYQHSFSRHD